MDTIETPRMMGMTGALKEIRAFIDSRNASKTIILNASATGSDRKVLKCKDCDTFRVKICKRPNDMWEITESIEDHGKCGEDGLIQPCMGSRRPSSKDVAADGGFEALMSSRTFSEERMSIGSIAATMREQLPTAHLPSRDVVKKVFVVAFQCFLKCGTFLNRWCGATLIATDDFSRWPIVAPLPSYPDLWLRYGAFIDGVNVSNIRIDGDGTGLIDGLGQLWWDARDSNSLLFERPRLIEPMFCSNLYIGNIKVINPPFWAIRPYACSKIIIENVDYRAPVTSPNTDGIDLDSCSHVRVSNFSAMCGDDAIAIKSGEDAPGRDFAKPTHDVLIEGMIRRKSGLCFYDYIVVQLFFI